jgi:hypothetical protein
MTPKNVLRALLAALALSASACATMSGPQAGTVPVAMFESTPTDEALPSSETASPKAAVHANDRFDRERLRQR